MSLYNGVHPLVLPLVQAAEARTATMGWAGAEAHQRVCLDSLKGGFVADALLLAVNMKLPVLSAAPDGALSDALINAPPL